MIRRKGCAGWLLAVGTMVSGMQSALAATPTPEIQKAVRAATFEVVLRKTETDPFSYEKPLPLDLVPFVIRNDKYWSIGTAFAIGANQFVSAGHVLLAAVGSQFGAPSLRDSAGGVYVIDQIQKFSAHQDFVVFSVANPPAVTPLTTTAERKLDDVVFAIGNALGEGVVIRDGLLTSETPENQDGRWKWLRFSAAASPGNSGGPLLDAGGRVIGIVTAKSPNENLNYALPIQLALDASAKAGSIDTRYTVKLPNARDTQVATLQNQIELPKKFADFGKAYDDILLAATRRDQEKLKASLAASTFPKGNSTKLLASVYDASLPGFVQKTTQDIWDVVDADEQAQQELPNNGLVEVGGSLGVELFRIRRPANDTDVKFYQDRGLFMDMLLKGLKLPRAVGDQAIRVTSMGQPREKSALVDRLGRAWQISIWPLGFADFSIVCYALPVPEGYVGFVQYESTPALKVNNERLKVLADALYVNYSGTLPQWRAFLANRDVRPKLFDRVKLTVTDSAGFKFESPRLTLQVPEDLVAGWTDGGLELHSALIADGDQAAWDVGGIYLYKDKLRHTFISVVRHAKPGDDSVKEQMETWNEMQARGPGFRSVAGHDGEFRSYWIHDALSAPLLSGPGIDPAARVLYDVAFSTESSVLPRDLETTEHRLLQATHVLER